MDDAKGESKTESMEAARSTEAIRADLEDTRTRMRVTLDEVGPRSRPQRLKQQAKDTASEATIGKVLSDG